MSGLKFSLHKSFCPTPEYPLTNNWHIEKNIPSQILFFNFIFEAPGFLSFKIIIPEPNIQTIIPIYLE